MHMSLRAAALVLGAAVAASAAGHTPPTPSTPSPKE